MIRNYFLIAWRTIIKHKVYTAINVLGLAISLCACIAIYLITSYEFSFDKFHPDGNRIYRIVGEAQNDAGEKMFLNNIIPQVAGFQNQVTGFDATAAFHTYGGSITIRDKDQQKKFDNKIDG